MMKSARLKVKKKSTKSGNVFWLRICSRFSELLRNESRLLLYFLSHWFSFSIRFLNLLTDADNFIFCSDLGYIITAFKNKITKQVFNVLICQRTLNQDKLIRDSCCLIKFYNLLEGRHERQFEKIRFVWFVN